jgi:peptidoglycan/xylan/chitin deacetylase (PgdA/CDA1 family)
MKGLYVSESLFRRQLTEWAQAGWTTTPLSPSPLTHKASPPQRQLVITFDDGFENVLNHGLGPLAQNGFHAIQFLISDRLGVENDWEQQLAQEAPARLMDVSQIREWLAAGHDIGAHTRTHPQLTKIPISKAREEIQGSRRQLEDLFGRPIHHFCYPYGDWNPAVRDLVAEAGFQTACTVEPGVNTAGIDPFGLKRFTARYRSRNWGSLAATVRDWFQQHQ